MDEEKHLTAVCPICGKENNIVLINEEEFHGMLEDIPGWTGYKYYCESCSFTATSEKGPEEIIRKLEWIKKGNPWKNLLTLTTGLRSDRELLKWLRGMKNP